MSEAFVGNCPNFVIFVRVTHCLTISSWGMFFSKWFIFTEKRFLFKSNSFFQCVSTNTLRRQLSSVNETAGVWIEAKALHHIPWWRGTRLWRSCKVIGSQLFDCLHFDQKSVLCLFSFSGNGSSFYHMKFWIQCTVCLSTPTRTITGIKINKKLFWCWLFLREIKCLFTISKINLQSADQSSLLC